MKFRSTWAGIIICFSFVIALAFGTGVFGFFILLVTLNGYAGHSAAVNASLVTYLVLATTNILIAASGSAILVYNLAHKRSYNLAKVLGSVSIGLVTVSATAHFVSLLIAVIVAEVVRSN